MIRVVSGIRTAIAETWAALALFASKPWVVAFAQVILACPTATAICVLLTIVLPRFAFESDPETLGCADRIAAELDRDAAPGRPHDEPRCVGAAGKLAQ